VKPDVVAPGRRTVSLRSIGSFLDILLPDRITDTNYFRLSGTSMAAPVVAGIAALIQKARPNYTNNQIKYIIKESAVALSGHSANTVGQGRVDALAAVQMALNGVGANKANKAQLPNSKMAQTIWPVVKTMTPKWRNTGWWRGRYWVDGGWDQTTGFRTTDGGWDDGGWDRNAWDNFSWEDGGWDSVEWYDGGWDSLTWEDGGWESGGWDSAAWDTVSTPLPGQFVD
jgi:hypothetical protein